MATVISDGGYPDGMAKPLINEMRLKRKMTKYRFAKEIKVHYSNVNRVLDQNYDPKLSVLSRVAKALKCRIRDLFEE